jgi:hypothetical protein
MPVNKMPIPKTIRVGKRRYSIEVVETLLQRRMMGRIDHDKQLIQIGRKSNYSGRAYTQAMMTDTFWHELVHAILNDMGEDELNRNEKFVAGFANRLTKAIQSARF